jgi:exodeoxyribonuclease VII large subunit
MKERVSELASIEQAVKILDPENILRRGYSITRVNGQLIRSASQVKEGDLLETRVADGQLASIVTSSSQQANS